MIFSPLVAVIIALDLRSLINVLPSKLLDFGFYLHGTNFFLAGGNPYLAPFPLVYPPGFLFFITPFALLPIGVAQITFTILSITSFTAALLILFKDLKPKHKLILILAAFQLFPVKFTLGLGQINLYIFLGFILMFHFLSKKKELQAGITLAIISLIKFNPILFIAYFFLTKNYKAIIYCLLFFIALNLGADLLTGHDLNLSFWQATLFRVGNPPLAYYNQSLPALLSRLNLAQLSLPISIIIFGITSINILKNPQNSLKNFSLFLVTLLLISPITWQHYLLWTIPTFLFLFSQKPSQKSLLYLLIFFLIMGNIKNPTPFQNNQLIFSHATLGLLLLYFFLLNKDKK